MTATSLVITGGATGIGRAVALLAARRGMQIALLDRDADAANSTAAEALAAGAPQAVALACNVSVEAEVAAGFQSAHDLLGPVTGLVTSAGIDRGGLLHEMSTETWDEVISTNLRGSYLAAKYAVRDFLASGTAGSIVCVSSPGGLVAHRSAGAYAASKAGVSALVRALAIDYGEHGIRANAVLPGPTETGLMWANVPSSDVAAMRQTIEREVPLARLADPNEPAEAVLWLLSSAASYVTGASLACDGGMLAKASISV